MPSSAAAAADAVLGVRRAVTSTRSPPTRAFSSSAVPSAMTRPWSMTAMRSARRSASSRYCVVSSTVVPVGDEVLDRLPQLERGCAGPGRSSARRGRAPAGARRAPPRGRAGGACRRSTSCATRPPASTRSKRSSSSCARRLRRARAARRTGARPSRGSRRRSGCRRPPRTGRPGRSARAARRRRRRRRARRRARVPASGVEQRREDAHGRRLAGAVRARARRARCPAAASRSTPSSARTSPNDLTRPLRR